MFPPPIVIKSLQDMEAIPSHCFPSMRYASWPEFRLDSHQVYYHLYLKLIQAYQDGEFHTFMARHSKNQRLANFVIRHDLWVNPYFVRCSPLNAIHRWMVPCDRNISLVEITPLPPRNYIDISRVIGLPHLKVWTLVFWSMTLAFYMLERGYVPSNFEDRNLFLPLCENFSSFDETMVSSRHAASLTYSLVVSPDETQKSLIENNFLEVVGLNSDQWNQLRGLGELINLNPIQCIYDQTQSIIATEIILELHHLRVIDRSLIFAAVADLLQTDMTDPDVKIVDVVQGSKLGIFYPGLIEEPSIVIHHARQALDIQGVMTAFNDFHIENIKVAPGSLKISLQDLFRTLHPPMFSYHESLSPAPI